MTSDEACIEFKKKYSGKLYQIGLKINPYQKWVAGNNYSTNDVVYYQSTKSFLTNAYKSLVDDNTTEPETNDNWEVIEEDLESKYIFDDKIKEFYEFYKNNVNANIAQTKNEEIINKYIFLSIGLELELNYCNYGSPFVSTSLSAGGLSASGQLIKAEGVEAFYNQTQFGRERNKLVDEYYIPYIKSFKIGYY